MSGLPSTVSESTRRRNPHLYPPPVKMALPANATPKKRIQQSPKPLMNDLEAEFYARIKDQYPNYPPVRVQAKRYRLANGLTYTPDFSASIWPYDPAIAAQKYGEQPFPPRETVWEVKGDWATDDAIAKVKMMAAAYPEIAVWLVWKVNGLWQEQLVLP